MESSLRPALRASVLPTLEMTHPLSPPPPKTPLYRCHPRPSRRLMSCWPPPAPSPPKLAVGLEPALEGALAVGLLLVWAAAAGLALEGLTALLVTHYQPAAVVAAP